MSDDPLHGVTLPTSRRRVLAVAAGLGATSLAMGTAAAGDDADDDDGSNGDDGDETDDEDVQPFAAIEFSNQLTDGTEIVVDTTTLSAGGYVAIHDLTLFAGELTGSVVGVTEYLDPGVHYSVPVTLFDVPGGEFDQDSLEGSTPLVAMPHLETTDDETYDFVAEDGGADGPYVEADLPVVDAGFATVGEVDEGETERPFATVDFENQAVSDDAVTIRDVTLSDGGFVMLHDARLVEGQTFESIVGTSEYLEPGRHQAVEVEIDDPSEIAEVALPARPLLPMPHEDTNDNQEADFVDTQGAEDVPYVKALQAVIDAGLVTVEN